jgi:phosphoribosylformylglycinamidine synthase
VRHLGRVEADLPIKELGDQAPEYDRPWVEPRHPAPLDQGDIRPPNDLSEAILKLMGSPDLSSRRWVFEQYDHVIGANTAQLPGGDAAVVRIRDNKAIALSVDVTPRYVEADPFEGSKQAVAECWRNLTAVGALPLAITDNLNFGNPERSDVMGQLVMSLSGIGEACRALDFPVVSGNVSLYNETSGTSILPTPTIGGVGLLEDLSRMATLPFKQEGDAILLIGPHGQHLGQSLYLREIHGREDGPSPPVDLVKEKRHGDFVRRQIGLGVLTAVHDISDGGLVACLCEMALAGNLGCRIDLPRTFGQAQLFGEDQARYVVTSRPEQVEPIILAAKAAGVPASWIGSVTGNAVAILGLATLPLTQLRSAHEGWFPAFMAGEV